MIQDYQFGRIKLKDKEYFQDLIIFPDRIQQNWWRKQGHLLQLEDLKHALDQVPEVLIIGTGYYGAMAISQELKQFAQQRGIELIALPTKQACETHNQLAPRRKVITALHLTC